MNKQYSQKIHYFLEINDISFKYYLGIYFVLLILDIWQKDFVFRYLHFPLEWLMWFVVFSGILKLFFNLDKLILWAQKSSFWYSKALLNFFSFLKKVEEYFCCFLEWFIKNINVIFSWSLIFYLALLLIGEFQDVKAVQKILFFERSPIKWFLNRGMNWLLGWIIITGIISVLIESPEVKEKNKQGAEVKIQLKDYLLIFGLGILGAGLIFYKTKGLGWISWVISIISGLLIILLSVIILEEDDEFQIK